MPAAGHGWVGVWRSTGPDVEECEIVDAGVAGHWSHLLGETRKASDRPSDYAIRPLRPAPDLARQRMWPDVRVPATVADEIARHGMQEVSGSSPLSSTPGERPFSRSRERAVFVPRGTLRGKIVAAPSGLPHRQGLRVGCEVILRPVSAREPVGYPLRSVTQKSVRSRGHDSQMMAAKHVPANTMRCGAARCASSFSPETQFS
jgi:hypothetical protein